MNKCIWFQNVDNIELQLQLGPVYTTEEGQPFSSQISSSVYTSPVASPGQPA